MMNEEDRPKVQQLSMDDLFLDFDPSLNTDTSDLNLDPTLMDPMLIADRNDIENAFRLPTRDFSDVFACMEATDLDLELDYEYELHRNYLQSAENQITKLQNEEAYLKGLLQRLREKNPNVIPLSPSPSPPAMLLNDHWSPSSSVISNSDNAPQISSKINYDKYRELMSQDSTANGAFFPLKSPNEATNTVVVDETNNNDSHSQDNNDHEPNDNDMDIYGFSSDSSDDEESNYQLELALRETNYDV